MVVGNIGVAKASNLLKVPNNLGLVSYWSFDDGAGASATDFSGNGNTGTLVSSPSWIAGVRGKAVSFNGSNEITASDALLPTGDRTIAMWIYPSAAQDKAVLGYGTLSSGAMFDVMLYGGKFCVHWFGNSCDEFSNTGYTAGRWQFLVLTMTSGTISIYIDGTFKSSYGAGISTTRAGVLHIGNGAYSSYNYFTGALDELRIYNRVISATEITSLYASSVLQFKNGAQGLVGYWPFNEGTGTVAIDKTGQGNDGTLTNGPTWVTGKYGKAVSFDGTDDYVSVATEPAYTAGATSIGASLWAYIDPTLFDTSVAVLLDSGSGIPNTNNGFFIVLDDRAGVAQATNGLLVSFDTVTGGVYSAHSNDLFPSAGWYHVSVSYSNGTGTIYINGVSQSVSVDNAGSGNYIPRNSALNIGNLNGNGYYFHGLIDDVRIYNHALSATEVASLYASSGEVVRIVNASQNTKVTNGLVGLWSFDGPDLNSTTSTDRSGQGNHGTLSGGPIPTYGVHGQALQFDGSDDNIITTNSLSAMPFTLAVWLKPTGSGSRAIMTGMSQGLVVYVTSGNAISFGRDTAFTAGTSVGTIPNDQWSHVVITDDASGNYVFYINGAVDSSGNHAGAFNSASLRIGRDADVSAYFKGAMDDFRFYNRALSATEVLQLYNAGK